MVSDIGGLSDDLLCKVQVRRRNCLVFFSWDLFMFGLMGLWVETLEAISRGTLAQSFPSSLSSQSSPHFIKEIYFVSLIHLIWSNLTQDRGLASHPTVPRRLRIPSP